MIVIPINGVIGWDVDERSLQESLAAAGGQDVELHFSTPGGLIGAGLGMGSQIRNYAGKTTAVITGYAMSMGSYLVQCCDHRTTMDDAAYLIHNARGGVYGTDDEIVLAWMKEETTFFGEDIIANGFVDELRASGKEIDKELNLATAMASYNEAMALLSKNEDKVKEDLNRAMAMNLADLPELSTPTPATAGIPPKEVNVMSLQALLAQNPAAKAEFDAVLATARNEGELAMKAVIDRVAPLMQSGAYPATVAKTALAVLKGEQSMVVLDASVAAIDALREEATAEKAAAETAKQKETPAGQVPGEGDVVSSEEDLTAAIAKAQNGEV